MYQIGNMIVFTFEDSIPADQYPLLFSLESYHIFCQERRNMQDMAMLLLRGGSESMYEALCRQEDAVSALAQQVKEDLNRLLHMP